MNSVAPLSTRQLVKALPPAQLAELVHAVAWDLELIFCDLIRAPEPDLHAIADLLVSVEAVMGIVRRHATYAPPASSIPDLDPTSVPSNPLPAAGPEDQALLLKGLLTPLGHALSALGACQEQFRAAINAHSDLAGMLIPLLTAVGVTDADRSHVAL